MDSLQYETRESLVAREERFPYLSLRTQTYVLEINGTLGIHFVWQEKKDIYSFDPNFLQLHKFKFVKPFTVSVLNLVVY